MPADDDARDLADQVQGALADLLHRRDNAMLTRFVVVAEVIEQEGERALWLLAPRDMKAWESIGMLEYARDLERQDDE
jgi:hypothetical protein